MKTLVNYCLFICRLILFILFLTVALKPPTNIKITTSGNNVTVTWTLPGESESYTYLQFYSSGRIMKQKYIKSSLSLYIITLESCKKYRLDMRCTDPNRNWSEKVTTTFWVTGK